MIESQIEEVVLKRLEEPDFEGYFLFEIQLSNKKFLEIIIDSDTGVTFEKCQKLSRHVENWLDTEGVLGDDYTLEVSSPGLSRPLKFQRQYTKNIGRTLEVIKTDGNKVEGVLQAVDSEKITLSAEEIRKEGKKKIKETIQTEIPFTNIKSATVKIVF